MSCRRCRRRKFQSTPPARGATDNQWQSSNIYPISIHAPREGGDERITEIIWLNCLFQSTPPARGATVRFQLPQPILRFQSTPPARGATLFLFLLPVLRKFQSTPPARGATNHHTSDSAEQQKFQSTPPARGATKVSRLFDKLR